MGVDLSTYVGPFFQCVPNLTKRQEVKVCCPEPNCQHYERISKDKFCPRCGSKIISVTIEKDELEQESERIAWDFLQGNQLLPLTEVNSVNHLYIPYDDSSHYRKINNKCEVGVVPLTAEDIAEAKEWLASHYSEAYEQLKSLYAQRVTVDFGVICSMS